MKEEDIGRIVVDWLESDDWDVYQEVKAHRGICDIVAVKDGVSWAIECKKGLGFPVLLQATNWRADMRSVACVPPKKGWDHRIINCAQEHFGCGVLAIRQRRYGDKKYYVEQRSLPPVQEWVKPYDKRLYKSLLKTLAPGHKTHAKAGTTGGKIFSKYRATMNQIQGVVEDNPGLTALEIAKLLDGRWHWKATKPYQVSRIIDQWCQTVEKKYWSLPVWDEVKHRMTYYAWGASSELKRGEAPIITT